MSRQNTHTTKGSPAPEGPVLVGSKLYRLLEMTARDIAARLLRERRPAQNDTSSGASKDLEPSPEQRCKS